MSMIRKYHDHKPQTTPWHRKEEPLNHLETTGRQIKQRNQLSVPHQDDCNTRKLTCGVLLLQDNAPAHTSQVVMTAATECGFEILDHPPYLPDMAPTDFYLFYNLEFHLCGTMEKQ